MVWRDRRTFFHLRCEDEDEKIEYKPWRTLWAFISVTLKNDQITEHLTVWRSVHPPSGKRFSPCSRVCSVQQGRNFMYREYTMTAIQRFVLQLSYMLMNLYERLNQKCLSSRFWQNIWCPVWSLRHQGTKRIQTMLLSSLIMVSPSLFYTHRLQQVNFIRREQSDDDEFVHEIWKMKMILVLKG